MMKLKTAILTIATLVATALPSPALNRTHKVCSNEAYVYYGTELRYGYTLSNGSRVQVVQTRGNYSQVYTHDMDKNTTSQWVRTNVLCPIGKTTRKPRPVETEYIYTYTCIFGSENVDMTAEGMCYHKGNGSSMDIFPEGADYDKDEPIMSLSLSSAYDNPQAFAEGSSILINGDQGVVIKDGFLEEPNPSCRMFYNQIQNNWLVYCGIQQ